MGLATVSETTNVGSGQTASVLPATSGSLVARARGSALGCFQALGWPARVTEVAQWA